MGFPESFQTKVVGVTFCEGYPENLYACQKAFEDHLPQLQRCTCSDWSTCRVCRGTGRVGGGRPMWAGFGLGELEPLPVVLIRRPENKFDSNAIEVHVPIIGQMIGHLPASMAVTMAPLMDSGTKFRAGVGSVNVMPGAEDQPGITIVVEAHQHQEQRT